jgi:hypothetical protein
MTLSTSEKELKEELLLLSSSKFIFQRRKIGAQCKITEKTES